MPIFADACRRSYFELGLPVATTDEGSGTHASRFSLPAVQLPHQASGHERVGISLVEKGRVINLSFRSVKVPRVVQMRVMAVKKSRKRLVMCFLSHFKCIYSS